MSGPLEKSGFVFFFIFFFKDVLKCLAQRDMHSRVIRVRINIAYPPSFANICFGYFIQSLASSKVNK